MEPIRAWYEEGVAWIEIHRPEKLNSLDRESLLALRDAVGEAAGRASTRVLLLTGAGDRAFCAGADIAEMSGMDASAVRQLMELGKEVARRLEAAPQPVIAAVNGYALGGGCELALACDLVVASERAQFGLPEVDLGILPGWGGTQRLERRVGYGRARDMILTGRRIAAAEALAWGLCERVAAPERLRDEALGLARAVAARDAGGLAAAKRALRVGQELPPGEGLGLETELLVELFERPERAAAMAPFVKRT